MSGQTRKFKNASPKTVVRILYASYIGDFRDETIENVMARLFGLSCRETRDLIYAVKDDEEDEQ